MKDNKDSKTLDMFDYGDSEYDNHEATEERLDNYGHSYKEWVWSEKKKAFVPYPYTIEETEENNESY